MIEVTKEKAPRTIGEQLFYQMLEPAAVDFTYVKVNGDVREARGTLNLDVIKHYFADNQTVLGKASKYFSTVNLLDDFKPGENGIIRYFDLDRGDIRSARVETLSIQQCEAAVPVSEDL